MCNLRFLGIFIFMLSIIATQRSNAMYGIYITPDDIGLSNGSSVKLKLFSVDDDGKSNEITEDIIWYANMAAGCIDENGVFTAAGMPGIYTQAVKASLGDGSEAFMNLEIINAKPSGGFLFERYWSTGVDNSQDYLRNGKFSIPCDVVVDTNGIVYVADAGNNRIQKFNSDGSFLESWDESLGIYIPIPWSISLDNFGNILSSYYKFDTSCNILQTYKLPSDLIENDIFSSGQAMGKGGQIYKANWADGEVYIFDTDGNYVNSLGAQGSSAGEFNEPMGIYVDKNGSIYIADAGNHRIQKFDSNEQFIGKFGSKGASFNQFLYPTDVYVRDNGDIFVVDAEADKIKIFDNEFNYITEIVGDQTTSAQLSKPSGISFDTQGNLYVANSGGNSIFKFTPFISVLSVSLDKTDITLEKGATETLITTVSPVDASNKDVVWMSSNTDVATVDINGLVTAKSGGICYITATTVDGGFIAVCNVSVESEFYFTSPSFANSYDCNSSMINIAGKRDSSITKASWQIDSNRKGTCKLSNGAWSASKVRLVLGDNLITITGINTNKQTFTDTLLVKYIDDTKPEVKISYPSPKQIYLTKKRVVNVSGTAKDIEAILRLTWMNAATGASGVCTGTKSWKASGIVLNPGSNEITIYAEDSSGNIGTSEIIVTMTDKTKPKVIIISPTNKSSLTLNEQNISLGGAASDDVEVAKIEWLNKSNGAYGNCNGTVSWNANAIPLQLGKNNISITATDTSGNKATDTLSITRKY